MKESMGGSPSVRKVAGMKILIVDDESIVRLGCGR
jgi:hypothetical protein